MTHIATAGAPAPATPLPPTRRSRGPWSPSAAGPYKPYKLPRDVQDRLTGALAGFRNREAAFALATWLARMWSAPKRLLAAFPIDRRAVAGREDLGLSEARVRGAIAALEEIGFLARYEAEPGRRYQRTEEGLHRRPILFRFGEEYGVEFGKANARAHAARGTAPPARRPVPRVEQLPTILGRSTAVSPPTEPKNRLPELRLHQMMDARPAPQLAQKQNLSGSVLIMGEERRAESSSALEAALARLGRGLGL